ncbi:unnamed protein product [Parnassius apollo]|uniref:(apollo) hypothetical protein n=1 Tax=Parnassius apollo TaxID=110799 RepID=A0A8S3WWV5_PARAO|nr:unnamed protein product [Parnassius apollo]
MTVWTEILCRIPTAPTVQHQRRETADWKQEINKRKRQFGYPYKGKKREETIWKYDVEKKGRVLKPRCKCRVSEKTSKLNCNKLTDRDREDIFNIFWKLSWDQKKVFVNNTMRLSKVHRPRDRKNQVTSRRKFSNEYSPSKR